MSPEFRKEITMRMFTIAIVLSFERQDDGFFVLAL